MPCRRKTVLSAVVLATPSAPPSYTCTSSISSTKRLVSLISPGVDCVVRRDKLQVEPVEVDAVEAHVMPGVQGDFCVLHRGGISAATGGHSVAVVRESDSVLEGDLAGVVRRARGIRSAAARAGRDAADVLQIHPDVNIRFVGRAGDADESRLILMYPMKFAPPPNASGVPTVACAEVCGGRVARRERQRRPVRAVRRAARRVGGNERHAQGCGAHGRGWVAWAGAAINRLSVASPPSNNVTNRMDRSIVI